MKYCIQLDRDGITSIKVSNGAYYIEGTSKFIDEAKDENVKFGIFTNFSCDYTLDKKDLLQEYTVKSITNTKKYSVITKCLWILFYVMLIASVITKGKNER